MSDSDWDETSEEIPNYLSAKEKFVQHMTRLTNYVEKPESATDLLNELLTKCASCGQKRLTNSECVCGDFLKNTNNEFRTWIENKMITGDYDKSSEKLFDGMTLAQYVDTEPARMSWQQLAKVIPPQKIIPEYSCDDSEEYNELQTNNPEEPPEKNSEYDSSSYEIEYTKDVEDYPGSTEDEPIQTNDASCNLINDIEELKESLYIKQENRDALISEREFLIEQLQACEDRIEEVEIEINDIENELDKLDQEYNENIVTDELIAELDEFSQAVQILLNASQFYDINDLICAYAKGNATIDDIKRQVILDAKLIKKQQLLQNVNMNVVIPKPRNADGLPNLHDTYLIDSYSF